MPTPSPVFIRALLLKHRSARTACCKNRGFGLDKYSLTVFDADRHYADYRTVLILDKVSGIPFVEEDSVVLTFP